MKPRRNSKIQKHSKGDRCRDFPRVCPFDTVLRNHGIFWSDKRILRDNLALTEDILAGRDAAIPLQMMGVPGFAGRPQEHPGTYGNIFYAAAKDARW